MAQAADALHSFSLCLRARLCGTLVNFMGSSLEKESTVSIVDSTLETANTVSELKAWLSETTGSIEESVHEKAKGDLLSMAARSGEIDSDYVKLVSSDGHEFVVKRGQAFISPTIKAMLNGPEFCDDGSERNSVSLRGIPSHVLHTVCKYFGYNERYTNSATEIPEFLVETDVALEALVAANFLNC